MGMERKPEITRLEFFRLLGEVAQICGTCGESVDDCTCEEDYIPGECEVCGGLGYFVVDWPICREEVMRAAMSKIRVEHQRP